MDPGGVVECSSSEGRLDKLPHLRGLWLIPVLLLVSAVYIWSSSPSFFDYSPSDFPPPPASILPKIIMKKDVLNCTGLSGNVLDDCLFNRSFTLNATRDCWRISSLGLRRKCLTEIACVQGDTGCIDRYTQDNPGNKVIARSEPVRVYGEPAADGKKPSFANKLYVKNTLFVDYLPSDRSSIFIVFSVERGVSLSDYRVLVNGMEIRNASYFSQNGWDSVNEEPVFLSNVVFRYDGILEGKSYNITFTCNEADASVQFIL